MHGTGMIQKQQLCQPEFKHGYLCNPGPIIAYNPQTGPDLNKPADPAVNRLPKPGLKA
jgi:hypothetical protein